MTLEQYLPDTIRKRYSLKLFGVSLLIVLLIAAFAIFISVQVSDRVTEEQLDSLEANAGLEAETLGQWIEGEQEAVRLLSTHQGLTAPEEETTPEAGLDDADAIRETLAAELAELPNEAARLSLVERTPEQHSIGADETVLVSTDPTVENEPLEETNIDWRPDIGYNFEDENDVILSWVYLDGDDPSVAIASPTPDGERAVIAEYRTNVRAEEFTSVLDGTDTLVLGGFTAFVLFDENKSNVMTRYKGDRENTTIGSLILDSDPFEELNGSVLTDDAVKGYHSVPGDDVDWVVVKEAPHSSALALTDDVQSDLAALLAMIFLGFVLVGVVAHRGPIRSLQQLAGQADAISNGDLSVEIEDEGRIDEIGDVRSAFRETKEYIETITKQSEALSRQEFEADVLEKEVPGRVGESIAKMQTDLERFIEELERERERYTTLVEQSSDGVILVQNGVCEFANDRFVEIMGYDREALAETSFIEFVVPEDRDLVRERYRQRLQGGSPPNQYEIGLETREGERRTVELSIARIEHDGEPAALANVRDVTERTRLERTYRELFENVADGLVIHDPDTGEILDVNDRFCEMNGYESSELVGDSLETIIPPAEEYSVEAAQEMIHLAREEGPQLFEWRNQHRSGDTYPVEVHLRAARIQGEERILASVREITERKRRERAVTELQNATERIQTAERPEQVARIAVETASEALDLPLAMCWLHDDGERRLEPAAATDAVEESGLVSGLSSDRYEYEVFERGEVTSYTPSVHAEENPLQAGLLLPLGRHGLLAAGQHDEITTDDVVLDIAQALAKHTTTALDRIQREQEVRESEQRFRLIAERIDEVIYLAELDFSELLYVNPAYEEIWGRPVDELYDDAAAFLDGIDSRDRDTVVSAFETMLSDMERGEHEDSYTFEFRVRTPDNEVNWVNATGYAVELASGERRFVGLVDDITERKRREQRLQVFNRVLRHNLRNQLDVIKGNAEVVNDRSSDRYARQIMASADRLTGISNRARTIDRILSREPRISTVAVADLIEGTLEGVDIDRTDIEVRTDLPASASIDTDEWVLEAVLESTVENALTYAESVVDVTVDRDADSCTIVVSDDGPGIPSDELETLDAGTETNLQHSRGLGLWQMKWGVDKLNGTLSFETDDGTTVRIAIPDRAESSD